MARDDVWRMRFEHRDVEDWMDKVHTIGEAESIRVGPWSRDDLEGAQHFVREFLQWAGNMEKLCADICF